MGKFAKRFDEVRIADGLGIYSQESAADRHCASAECAVEIRQRALRTA